MPDAAASVTERGQSERRTPNHEQLYRRLRTRIMHGAVEPGQAMTLRGIAAEFGVSMTPAREAARRLVAEGALQSSSSGRITTPVLSNERIEELAALRALLEPELASRALPRAHGALIDRMTDINDQIERVLGHGDAIAYVRLNLDFHRNLYLRAQAPAMLALAETVWLQLGPSMRSLYSESRRAVVTESHSKILSALRAGDEPGLRVAVRADVTSGLRMLLS
ncbi:GntR family transcriptional regulator [Oceanibium sediminis]|uniref:GntR family transcriptional regulator n=1 Tax=Oceanibium sediminis TaxID=2026339 RepID=UPI001E398A09|nr:GntR family transcriptional regulator [Oceanibium sediminis]